MMMMIYTLNPIQSKAIDCAKKDINKKSLKSWDGIKKHIRKKRSCDSWVASVVVTSYNT